MRKLLKAALLLGLSGSLFIMPAAYAGVSGSESDLNVNKTEGSAGDYSNGTSTVTVQTQYLPTKGVVEVRISVDGAPFTPWTRVVSSTSTTGIGKTNPIQPRSPATGYYRWNRGSLHYQAPRDKRWKPLKKTGDTSANGEGVGSVP